MRRNLGRLLLVCLCAVSASSRTVELTLAPRLIGNTIYIEGTANLPDSAVIEWEIHHEKLFERRDIPIEYMAKEGHAIVRGHRYYAAVDLTNWIGGSIEIWVAFQPRSYGTRQPAHINVMYGTNGEWIEGSNVSYHPAQMRRVELIKNLVLPEVRAARVAGG